MTCRLAFSYGREVYALPGRVDDLRSQGCNLLIKDKIAEPITSERELIKSLGLKAASNRKHETDKQIIEKTYAGNIPQDKISQMASILLLIKAHRGITIEEISQIFMSMGYSIAEGPQVESVFNAFVVSSNGKYKPASNPEILQIENTA